MARIAGVNIPQNKVVHVALQYIHGIGKKFSNEICTKLNIQKNKRTNSLTEEEVLKIREFIGENYKVEGDLRREISLKEALIAFWERSLLGSWMTISINVPIRNLVRLVTF